MRDTTSRDAPTRFAISTEETRYYLNGIYLHAAGSAKAATLRGVATDGHRLAFASATLDVEVPKQEVILPRKTVVELQRLLSETSVGLCQSYGMTELSGSVAFLTVEDHQRAAQNRPDLLHSVGRVLPTAQVRLVNDSGGPCAVGIESTILDFSRDVPEILRPGAITPEDIARVIGVHYPQTEGSGATFLDSGGDGVNIAVGGTTAGAWANAGWFTHHSAGNAMAIKNDPFIDNIIDMSVDGSIIVGTDVYFTAWPTGTEVVWSMHRSDLSSGGIRFPAITTAGRIALYYRPNGGTEIVALGHNMSSGYLGTRISTLFEFAVDIANNSLRTNLWVNGEQVRSNTIALGSPPTALSTGGMQLSGYGTGTNYLGSSGAGTPGNNARTRNAFALRHSGADRNIAARLAKYVYDNNALPTWLVRS